MSCSSRNNKYRNQKFSYLVILGIIIAASLYILNHFGDIIYAQPVLINGIDPVDNFSDQQSASGNGKPNVGINMRGYNTSIPQSREFNFVLPDNYYESSFKILSKTNIIDHVRYRFYWESYAKNSSAFLKEIGDVAKTADKYGIKVIYDNHQFHTSSWLNVERGTGFPTYLFSDPTLYKQGSGGSTKYSAAKAWWTKWWDREIKGTNGTDGWTLQAEFMKKILGLVDKHSSTLGYEILSEPQVHSKDQWEKIGKYNTFMTDELRKITNKTIVYSMNIPIDLKSPIKVNPVNLAKMTPSNKKNVIFKFSLYGIPSDGYQSDKLQLFENTSHIAEVPLYIGEWNNVKRVATFNEQHEKVWKIDGASGQNPLLDSKHCLHLSSYYIIFFSWY